MFCQVVSGYGIYGGVFTGFVFPALSKGENWIKFNSDITDEQQERLTDIAKACPISRIIAGKVDVRTYVYSSKEVEKQIKYSNNDIVVFWRPELCKHSGRCVTQLPGVFNLQQHPWINMEGATTEQIKAQVLKCPTGALSVKTKVNSNEIYSI